MKKIIVSGMLTLTLISGVRAQTTPIWMKQNL